MWGVGIYAILLNFGIIQNPVINFTFCLMFSPYPLNGRLSWSPAGLDAVKKKKDENGYKLGATLQNVVFLALQPIVIVLLQPGSGL
jgi:hypothetical protein